MTSSLAPRSIIYVYVFVYIHVYNIHVHIYACTDIQSIHINQSIRIKVGLERVSGGHPVLPCAPRPDHFGLSGCSWWVFCVACGLTVPHPQVAYFRVPLALTVEGFPSAKPESLLVSPWFLELPVISNEDAVACSSRLPDFQLINENQQEFVSYPQKRHCFW